MEAPGELEPQAAAVQARAITRSVDRKERAAILLSCIRPSRGERKGDLGSAGAQAASTGKGNMTETEESVGGAWS